ncbi:hypothetical protein J7E62_31080 [Variovorax paradoxus]|nr:hypothetical protein [Variovorax paradoxus]
MPRLLTAYGKAKSASPNGGPRSGFEVVDRRGFVRLVGSMATSPQNDAGVADLSSRFEAFDVMRRVWVAADSRVVYRLGRMAADEKRRFMAARVGLLREVAGDHGGVVDGEAWHCPADYDRERDRSAFLAKALRVGLLSIGGRTYKIRVRGASPWQGGGWQDSGSGGAGTIVYELTRAAGTVRMTHEALLMSIEQGSI